jgi:hypothetical protein
MVSARLTFGALAVDAAVTMRLTYTQMLGPEMGNYVVVTTTEPDENGRPKKPGSINGGFFQKSNDKPDQYPSVVIAVDDIQQH